MSHCGMLFAEASLSCTLHFIRGGSALPDVAVFPDSASFPDLSAINAPRRPVTHSRLVLRTSRGRPGFRRLAHHAGTRARCLPGAGQGSVRGARGPKPVVEHRDAGAAGQRDRQVQDGAGPAEKESGFPCHDATTVSRPGRRTFRRNAHRPGCRERRCACAAPPRGSGRGRSTALSPDRRGGGNRTWLISRADRES